MNPLLVRVAAGLLLVAFVATPAAALPDKCEVSAELCHPGPDPFDSYPNIVQECTDVATHLDPWEVYGCRNAVRTVHRDVFILADEALDALDDILP